MSNETGTVQSLKTSIYRHPIASLLLPENALKSYIDALATAREEAEDYKTRNGVTQRLGAKVFEACFNCEENNEDGIHYLVEDVGVKIHVKTISDYSPAIGSNFNAKLWRIRTKLTVVHVFMTILIPQIDIIGWISNSDLKTGGQVTEIDDLSLKSIVKHPILFKNSKIPYA